MKQKILSLLVLLMTAATGAWADWTGGTYTATTNEELGAITVGADATLTINEGVTVTVKGGINANGHTLTVNGAGTLTVTGTNGADGASSGEYDGGGGGIGSAGFTGTLIVDGATVNVTGGNGGNGGSGFQYGGNGGNGAAGVSGSITLNSGSATVTGGAGGNGGGALMKGGSRGSAGQAVTETITASTAEESDDNSTWTAISGNTSSKRYVRAESTAPAVEVTTNAAQAGDFFTEATFNMPTFDATVGYDIVRDMSDATYPVEFSGITERVVVKKGSEGKYQPVTTLTIQLIDELAAAEAQNIIAADGITIKVLRGTENSYGGIDYDETNPIAYADFLADMQPGLYMLVAVPTDATTSPYTGAASLTFEALAGFPVEVAGGEYVTYYSDTDNLALEDNAGAKLYTITNVGDTEATATEITSANKEMPFLLYNPTEETKTFLLIPTDATINQSYATEFVGTAEATTIAASTATLSNYAFNGKQFVYVKNALDVAANKAWLAISSGELQARTIVIVFGDSEATGIRVVSGSAADAATDWYDLNGRKLDKKPTQKGIYINNGRKVVVK